MVGAIGDVVGAADERLLKKIGFAELFRLQEQLVVLRGLEPSGSQTLGMHRVHPIIGTFGVDRQEAWGRKNLGNIWIIFISETLTVF